MPSLSVILSSFRGNPTFDILRSGQPWGEDNVGPTHFSFGITKARMVRAALPILEKFVESAGGQPWPGQKQEAKDLTGIGIVLVQVEKRDYFENASGNQINQPYLKLTSGDTSIGLGLAKCQALVFLAAKLEGFLESNGQKRLSLSAAV
jgi:hypothetical protein